MNNLRASNPEAQDADVSRAMPNFGQRYQARMIRRFSIGVAAIAVLSVPAVLNFVGQGGAGDEVQISSEVIDGVKGATQKGGQKSGKKATNSAQSVSFAGAPSLELGASPTELVGADQNFRSPRDGFAFPNYSGKPTNDEIDATVMAALFGKEAVCADKNAALCAMLPGAQAVANQLNEAMASGRCEGMAVLAQRFYDGMENRPNGAASTGQIAQDVVAKQIGYWWATQVAPTVAANSKLYRSMSPTQITSELINGLRNRSGFTLGLYSAAGGHAVTPIAVTKDGDNFNIYVYDNNYPGEIRKVLVNSASQTWTYGAAALSAGAQSNTWTGTGAGSMDLTSMASRQDRPFKVSLGGTKGIKGTSYSVIVTQQGNSTVPLGFKLSHPFGELNSLDTKSVATATFPVKSFLGAGGNQGAIAFIPTALSDVSGMKLEIVGGKNTGKYTVSIMRTGSTGAVVESNSKFDISVANTSFSTVIGVDLLNPSQKALVRLSNGNAGVDIRLVDGQSVEVTSPTTYDDAFRGARRIESTGPPFIISKWSGEEIASGKVEQNLSKGEAKIVKFSVDSQTGKVNQRFTDTTKSIIDEVFVRTLVPGKNYLNYDTVTKKPSAALIDIFNPIQLPIRAIAGAPTTTSTTIATTTTVAPAAPPAPPAPPTELAPESVVVTLSAQRYYGDTNSSIKDTAWGMTCADTNTFAPSGCTFLKNAMKTSSMSELMTMSITLDQMAKAKVVPYSSKSDGDVLSAEMKAIAGWPSNYSAEIIVQLEVKPRPVTVTAVAESKVFGSSVDEKLTFETTPLVGNEKLKGSLTREKGSDVETYKIQQGTVTNEENPNYAITYEPADFTITPKPITVEVEVEESVTVGEKVTASVKEFEGPGEESWSADPLNVCTIDPTTGDVTTLAAGECVITATVEATKNYGGDTDTKTIVVVLKAQTMTVTLRAERIYGDENTEIKTKDWNVSCVDSDKDGSNSGCAWLKNLLDTQTPLDVVDLKNDISVTANAGIYSSLETSDLAGTMKTGWGMPSNYSAPIVVELVVKPRPVTVTVKAVDSLTVEKTTTATATVSPISEGNVTWSASPSNVCTIDPETGEVTTLAAGNCFVTAKVDAIGNYAGATSDPKLIVINLIPVKVTVSVVNVMTDGAETLATATVSPSSGGKVTWSVSPEGTCKIAEGGLVTSLTVGTCTVTASVAANGNYAAGLDSATIKIQSKANCGGGNGLDRNTPGCPLGGRNEPKLTVTELSYMTLGEKTQATESHSGMSTVTWSVGNEGTCTTSESGVITAIKVGTCTVTASVSENDVYAAESKSITITINSLPVVVTVTADSSIKVDAKTRASTSFVSTGTLSWSVGNEETCTISESGWVTAVKVGTCTVTASVSADGNYSVGSGSTTITIEEDGSKAQNPSSPVENSSSSTTTTTTTTTTTATTATTATTTTAPPVDSNPTSSSEPPVDSTPSSVPELTTTTTVPKGKPEDSVPTTTVPKGKKPN